MKWIPSGRVCPGGTPPIYFAGREHCIGGQPPPGLSGLSGRVALMGGLGGALGAPVLSSKQVLGIAVIGGVLGAVWEILRPFGKKRRV